MQEEAGGITAGLFTVKVSDKVFDAIEKVSLASSCFPYISTLQASYCTPTQVVNVIHRNLKRPQENPAGGYVASKTCRCC